MKHSSGPVFLVRTSPQSICVRKNSFSYGRRVRKESFSTTLTANGTQHRLPDFLFPSNPCKSVQHKYGKKLSSQELKKNSLRCSKDVCRLPCNSVLSAAVRERE